MYKKNNSIKLIVNKAPIKVFKKKFSGNYDSIVIPIVIYIAEFSYIYENSSHFYLGLILELLLDYYAVGPYYIPPLRIYLKYLVINFKNLDF